MLIFIRADSVLVHKQSSDSLMSGCPHITPPPSERQLNGGWREGGREEGRRWEGRGRGGTQSLRMHCKAACKI